MNQAVQPDETENSPGAKDGTKGSANREATEKPDQKPEKKDNGLGSTIGRIASTPVDICDEITAADFRRDYFSPNKPVILRKLTSEWPARAKWSTGYLAEVAGDRIVPLYSSKPAKGHKHQHAADARMPLRDYLEQLEAGEQDLRMFFYNILENAPELVDDFSYPDLGLKFFKRLPVLFMGGRGAKVQMHFDIDYSNLLLCHFGGRKRVLLVPPEQSQFMYRVPYSFSALYDVDFDNPDFSRFPALARLNAKTAELMHGDVLFIPSGYWHYIVYEDVGFSMTLRSMPTRPKQQMALARNILITRTVDGLMRRLIGQRWNERNERRALTSAVV
ncbi:MAG: cupin-like domain-containing protein [Pseudomonadota bacterium]